MHNIWPVGQMWPAEAFYLARKAQNFILKACLLEKTPSVLVKTYRFWPFYKLKKILGPRLRFELCTPALDESSNPLLIPCKMCFVKMHLDASPRNGKYLEAIL